MPEILEFDKMFYKNFEPKMGNRFIMEINGIESYLIKTAARPTFTCGLRANTGLPAASTVYELRMFGTASAIARTMA